jgi:hypothetical protein
VKTVSLLGQPPFLSLSACAVRAAILAKASEYLDSRPHSSDDERKRIGLAKALDHRSARSRKRSAPEIDDANLPALTCGSTPPGPINYAGGVKC